jgi:hypothetical protein
VGKKSPEIIEFQKCYGITESEMWEVRPGAWAVKHSAIERIVAEKGIKFERPAIIEVNTAEKIMVICVFGTLGDRTEWSFGEASPANCKIAQIRLTASSGLMTSARTTSSKNSCVV